LLVLYQARRDKLRLDMLRQLCALLCTAAALLLLQLVEPAPGWVSRAGLLALAAVGIPQLRRATQRPVGRWRNIPALLAASLLCLPLFTPINALQATVSALVLLLVPLHAMGDQPGEQRLGLLVCALAALLACTAGSSSLLAPLLLLCLLSGSLCLLLYQLADADSQQASRCVPLLRAQHAAGGLVLALVVAAFSFCLFLTIPRNPARPPRLELEPTKLVGFGRQVRLGALETARDDPSPVFRVKVTDAQGHPLPGPFHFRGVTLDRFDGWTWSAVAAPDPPPAAAGAGGGLRQRYLLEPTAPPLLFSIPQMSAMSLSLSELRLRDGGALLHRARFRRLSYQVSSEPTLWRPPAALPAGAGIAPEFVSAEHRQLPAQLDPRVAELAQRISAQAGAQSQAQVAAALLGWLHSEPSYGDPQTQAAAERTPLQSFLFGQRKGRCEIFATALAIMLRTQGVPTRLVNGFAGGSWNPVGGYWLLRHSDAHSWVEAHLDGVGWISLEATPPRLAQPDLRRDVALLDHAASRWNQAVLEYELDDQVQALAAIGSRMRRALPGASPAEQRRASADSTGVLRPDALDLLLPLLLALLGVLAAGGLWRRALAPWLAGERSLRRSARGQVERQLRRGRRLVSRRGWDLPPCLPPLEAARWLEKRAGPAAAPLTELARLHYQVRYAGASDETLAVIARNALQALRALPRRSALRHNPEERP